MNDTPLPSNPKDALGMKKVALSVVPSTALLHLAMAMMDGAKKYGPFNWRDNAVRADIYLDALDRHKLLWSEREEVAQDSGCHHLGHAMACCAILLDAQETGNLIDTRPHNGATAALLDRLNAQIKGGAK